MFRGIARAVGDWEAQQAEKNPTRKRLSFNRCEGAK